MMQSIIIISTKIVKTEKNTISIVGLRNGHTRTYTQTTPKSHPNIEFEGIIEFWVGIGNTQVDGFYLSENITSIIVVLQMVRLMMMMIKQNPTIELVILILFHIIFPRTTYTDRGTVYTSNERVKKIYFKSAIKWPLRNSFWFRTNHRALPSIQWGNTS